MDTGNISMTSTNDRDDTAEDISVAAELKFLVPYLPAARRGGVKPQGPEENVPMENVDYIEDTGQVSESDRANLWRHCFGTIAKTIRQVMGDAISSFELDRKGMKERECWEGCWIVKKSNSAEPAKDDPQRDSFLWVPVEINSPKMAWKDPGSLSTIKLVLDALRARFHIVSNYSCEVHVHIGRIDGCPFSLPGLKRIAMLLWLSEPIMRLVKDPLSPNYEHVYTWSWAARQHSRLARDIHNGKRTSTPTQRELEDLVDPAVARYLTSPAVAKSPEHQQALRLILGASSHLKLGRLLSGEGRPHRRLGFNFSAFGAEDERARTNPKTVECRFLEGTMDANVVLAWIRIYGTMVEVALDQPARFAKTVLRLVETGYDALPCEEDFRLLMEDLGVSRNIYWPVQMMISRIHTQLMNLEKMEQVYG